MMETASLRTVFDVVTDFLASDPTPDELINYHLPDDLQARAHTLLERNSEDLLTDSERQEMLDFMSADEMMSMLKAKTRLKLKR